MKANSRQQAWEMVDEVFPTDYEKAEEASERAGYDVYVKNGDRCPTAFCKDWISDLGNRLEVNLSSGKTINIWIESPTPEFTEGQIGDVLHIINDAIYEIDDNIGLKLQKATHIDEARKILYGAYSILYGILSENYPDSELIERYNLKDA